MWTQLLEICMNRYRCWIRLPNVADFHVTVDALNHFQAQAMMEAQYGKSAVMNVCSA